MNEVCSSSAVFVSVWKIFWEHARACASPFAERESSTLFFYLFVCGKWPKNDKWRRHVKWGAQATFLFLLFLLLFAPLKISQHFVYDERQWTLFSFAFWQYVKHMSISCAWDFWEFPVEISFAFVVHICVRFYNQPRVKSLYFVAFGSLENWKSINLNDFEISRILHLIKFTRFSQYKAATCISFHFILLFAWRSNVRGRCHDRLTKI